VSMSSKFHIAEWKAVFGIRTIFCSWCDKKRLSVFGKRDVEFMRP